MSHTTATPRKQRPLRRGSVPAPSLPPPTMTEEEFVAWCDEDTRAEWVDGRVVPMAPESGEHNELLMWLVMLMKHVVDARDSGVVRTANFTVRLPRQRRRRMPDLLFVAAARKAVVKDTYVDGAPDLVVEIVSPDSGSRDLREKYLEYEKAGVKEYWIIDPLSRHAEVYALKGRKYVLLTEDPAGAVRSTVLPGFVLKTKWLWQRPLPNVLKTLRELGIRT